MFQAERSMVKETTPNIVEVLIWK